MFGKSTKQQISEASAAFQGDLDKAITKVRGELKDVQTNLGERVSKIEEFLQTKFKAVEEKADQAYDGGRGYCDRAIADLLSTIGVDVERHNKELGTAMPDLSRALKQIEFLERDLKHKADELSASVQDLTAEAEAREQATAGLEASVSALKVRSSQLSGETHTLQEQVGSLLAASEAGKQDTGQRLGSVADRLAQEVQRLEETASKSQADMRSELDTLQYNLTDLTGKLKRELNQHGSKSTDAMDEFRRQLDDRFQAQDREIDRAREAVSMVINTFTRTVEWTIKGARRKIKPPELEEGQKGALAAAKWLSPKFSAGGLRDLQLELQVFNPETFVDGHEDDMRDCALLLWANAGVSAVFRLWIGTTSQVVEQTFEGHEPHGAHRLCIIDKAINNRGELPMGVEILEVTSEEDVRLGQLAKQSEDAPVQEGGLHLKRHVNNRIFGQVRQMADQMQARLVRRVEWKFEQASQLQRNFGPGSPIYSKEFGAGGILGLQFIFYPSGYFGAEEGFCSLFLHAPPGTVLAGSLQLGTQRRDISHSFDEKGNFGKTNFCRLDSCFDPKSPADNVLLAFEIDEAYQEERQTDEHTPGAGSPTIKMRASTGNRSTLVSKKRAPPSTLVETKALPTLWATGRPVHPQVGGATSPNGYSRSRSGFTKGEGVYGGPLGASGKLLSGTTSEPNLLPAARAKRALGARSGAVGDEIRW